MDFLETTTKRFKTTQLSHWKYKISANFSLGTLQISGFGVPISICMSIENPEMGNPKVSVNSKIRVEHYFFAIVFGFIIPFSLLSDQPWYFSLFSFGLFFVVHFWFHLVYRVQENELTKKLIGQLKLNEL